MEIKNNKFYILGGRERIILNNGLEISVINCYGSYTDNKFDLELLRKELKGRGSYKIISDEVELAVIKDGEFATKEYLYGAGDVVGHITPQQYKKIIEHLKEAR